MVPEFQCVTLVLKIRRHLDFEVAFALESKRNKKILPLSPPPEGETDLPSKFILCEWIKFLPLEGETEGGQMNIEVAFALKSKCDFEFNIKH